MKKPSKKYNRKTQSVKYGYLSTAFRWLCWLVPGFMIGLFVPWILYLQMMVSNQFVKYHWKIPSSVYAQELNFFDGKKLTTKALEFELNALGYKKKSKPHGIGEYSMSNNLYVILTKGFNFFDKPEKPKKITFSIKDGELKNLNYPLARLEPLLIGNFYNNKLENRQLIKISEIPNTLVMGLQAIEDRNFNHHIGIDIFGILRAAVKNIFAGRIVQGGSTLTQQLIKNRFDYQAKSFIRKINEALAAIILERKFNKGQILEHYFNEIYWGQNGKIAIHGINQAAQYYFSKSPKQLTIAEQAMLTGMIKGPSWYNPVHQKQRSMSRRNVVLDSWLSTSVISKKQWQKAKNEKTSVVINNSFSQDKYKDFLGLVKQQLSQTFSQKQLNQSGLKIFTSLNPYIQDQVVNTLRWHTNTLGDKLQSAAVVSDAQTGELFAIKGSKELHSYYNRAILSKRQIGSLIKPFVYLAALELIPSFHLNKKIYDTPVKLKTNSGEYWQPKNWDNKSLGKISAKKALVNSRNQATVNLGLQIGVADFILFLKSLGLSINHSNHPSVFLGATELTPLEVNNLYLILSSTAKQQYLNGIKKVVDRDNNLLGQFNKRNQLSLNSQSVREVTSAMHEITVHGTARKLTQQFGFSGIYGKTGTTNNGKNSWYVGFDQKYLATFWVGKDDNTSTDLTGGTGAMKLWANWYNKIK